jgi:prepilin-type N-terminal cleavage/methylation domain-containing protein
MIKEKKGFTLIELLIVIAIVAILSVVVILTLNPAELLKQARDSNRISDLNVLKSAISLYLADGLTWSPTTFCTASVTSGTIAGGPAATASGCGLVFPTISTVVMNATGTTSTAVTGTGWIPLNFSAISSGAPIGALPRDPVNNGTYYYAYYGTSTNSAFKIVAKALESTKYGTPGANQDVVSTDGGTSSTVYEAGTNLAL